MKIWLKLLSTVVVVCLLVVSMAGCASKQDTPGSGTSVEQTETQGNSGSSKASKSSEKKILRVARPEDVVDWDPYDSTLNVMLLMGKLIWSSLVDQEDDGTLIPGLAKEWFPNENGTEWTFKLVEGVKYQNGEDFNAEAVKISIERFKNEKLVNSDLWTTLESIDVIDNYTVKMTFSKPTGALPYNLVSTPMLCPSIVKN